MAWLEDFVKRIFPHVNYTYDTSNMVLTAPDFREFFVDLKPPFFAREIGMNFVQPAINVKKTWKLCQKKNISLRSMRSFDRRIADGIKSDSVQETIC